MDECFIMLIITDLRLLESLYEYFCQLSPSGSQIPAQIHVMNEKVWKTRALQILIYAEFPLTVKAMMRDSIKIII